jgi:hypothetical protein
MYMFYLANRIIEFERGAELLPAIHQRLAETRRRGAWGGPPPVGNREEIAQLVYESL